MVAQELLGRRFELAEEGLLSPCAGGLERSPRLLSAGWIAVGDEIWLDMAAGCIFGPSSDDSFWLSGCCSTAAGSEQRGSVCCGGAPRDDSKSAVTSKLRGQLPVLADARWYCAGLGEAGWMTVLSTSVDVRRIYRWNTVIGIRPASESEHMYSIRSWMPREFQDGQVKSLDTFSPAKSPAPRRIDQHSASFPTVQARNSCSVASTTRKDATNQDE